MNTSKLLFQGYASHDLDEIHTAFKLKAGKEPAAFVIRPNYVVSGKRENHNKIVISRLSAFGCVMVPLELTKSELETVYSNLSDYHAIERAEPETVDPELSHVWDDDNVRYCIHCGQAFEAEINNPKLICDKPECAQKEKNHKEAVASVKKEYARPTETKEPKPITASYSDNFELIDPYSNAINGYIYLIESDNGLSKIGRSDDVYKRFSDLMMMNAANLTLRHAIHTNNSARAEFHMHKMFQGKVHHGEWYRLTNEDISWFVSMADGALDNV